MPHNYIKLMIYIELNYFSTYYSNLVFSLIFLSFYALIAPLFLLHLLAVSQHLDLYFSTFLNKYHHDPSERTRIRSSS